MKKISFISGIILPALISLLFVSCKKEKPLDEAIIGKWNVQTEQQVYYLQNVKKFESTYFYEESDLAFEFTAGGSIIIYQAGDIFGMSTFTISGNKIIVETGDTDMEWDNVSIDGNTLTWSESGTDTLDNITYDVDINYTAVKD